MSAQVIVAVIFLWAGVSVELICALGVLIMPGTYEKLHYLGPASSVGPVLIAIAVIVQDGWTQATVKAVILALLLLWSGAVLSHATARAAKIRAEAGWDDESPDNGGT